MIISVFVIILIIIIVPCILMKVYNMRADEQYLRMREIERLYNYEGTWEDCGDGTCIYMVDGNPIIESLEMLPLL